MSAQSYLNPIPISTVFDTHTKEYEAILVQEMMVEALEEQIGVRSEKVRNTIPVMVLCTLVCVLGFAVSVSEEWHLMAGFISFPFFLCVIWSLMRVLSKRHVVYQLRLLNGNGRQEAREQQLNDPERKLHWAICHRATSFNRLLQEIVQNEYSLDGSYLHYLKRYRDAVIGELVDMRPTVFYEKDPEKHSDPDTAASNRLEEYLIMKPETFLCQELARHP
jgi:hypothetical protein